MSGLRYVIWIEEIEDRDAPRVGAKAARIAALRRKGFPVPDGFVVTRKAHRAFEESAPNGRPRDTDAAIEIMPQAVQAEVRQAYRELVGRIGSTGLVAVRSSGVLEDLDRSSFAGQYRTDLGILGEGSLIASVARCWLSGSSKGVERYREARGLGNGDSGMGVIVQEMVPAEASGVLFTADPMTGKPDRMAVDCAWGLGETVVTGTVVPDHFILDRESFAVRETRLGTKDRLVAASSAPGGGTEEREVPEPQASAPCLTQEQLAELAALARRIEDEMGGPQDIEWAFTRGRFYLLQSRPITVGGQSGKPAEARERGSLETPADPVFPVYTTAGIREMLPGVLTPLTWSFVGPPMEKAYQRSAERLGLIQGPLPEHAFLGFFFGRPCLNLSRQRLLSTLLPGGMPAGASRELAATSQRDGAGEGAGPARAWFASTPTPLLGPVTLRVRSSVRAALLAQTLPRRAARLEVEVWDYLWELGMKDASLQGPEACVGAMKEMREVLERVCSLHVTATLVAAQMHDWLTRLTRWLVGPDSSGTREALLAGLDLPVDADAHNELWRISREIASTPGGSEKAAHWARTGLEGIEREGTAEATRFARRFKGFLAEHGHKGFGGVELRARSWRDDPDPLLLVLNSLLEVPDEDGPEAVGRKREGLRKGALDRVAASRSVVVRRMTLKRLLFWTRELLSLRERLKDLVTRLTDQSRGLARRLGAGCEDKGILAKADDVFYLTIDEITGACTGPDVSVRPLVEERSAEWAEYEALGIPEVFRGRPDPYPLSPPPARTRGSKLAGIGVSPGRAQARVRVVRTGAEACAVKRGEILVARSADASWAPLMLLATGLVTETGGSLSHGSILAREFALPAVAGVRDGTHILQTGDEITLDGASGEIEIVGGHESAG